ncbi:MAG: hypothetical protein O3B01_05280 [Planctomycetota bacterium]|nr:hypothetical protein [Planctomycetota bacterium]
MKVLRALVVVVVICQIGLLVYEFSRLKGDAIAKVRAASYTNAEERNVLFYDYKLGWHGIEFKVRPGATTTLRNGWPISSVTVSSFREPCVSLSMGPPF